MAKRLWRGIAIVLLLSIGCLYGQMAEGGALVQISGKLVDKLDGNFSATFQSTPLMDVFRILASETGLNIMVSPRVNQTLTAKFKDVLIKDAFLAILSANDLYYIEQGSIVKVVTLPEYRNELTRSYIVTKTYDASIMDIKNLATVLKPLLTPGIGNFMIDSQSSKIIVADIKDNFPKIDKLFQDISSLPPMVELETKILQIDLDGDDENGVNINALNIANNAVNVNSTPGYPITSSLKGGYTGVIPGTGINVDATIAMISKNNKSKIISQPKILCLNREKADILIGSKVPYIKSVTTIDTTGKTSSAVDFIETGVKIEVEPVINDDGEVKLNLKASLSSSTSVTLTQDTNSSELAPLITTTEVNCTTISRDNQTIIIGGLISSQVQKKIQAVPILGYIPILNFFFSYQIETTDRTEIIIFITPKILRNGKSNMTFDLSETNTIMEAGFSNFLTNNNNQSSIEIKTNALSSNIQSIIR